MAKFQPGNPGRPKGSRNRLHKDILDAYSSDFATHGPHGRNSIRTHDAQICEDGKAAPRFPSRDRLSIARQVLR